MLTRLIFIVVLCVTAADAGMTSCSQTRGNQLSYFERPATKEVLNFPCNHNAMRKAKCGPWKISMSPENALDVKSMKYYIKSLRVRVENSKNGSYWEGYTNFELAKQFLKTKKGTAFETQGGSLANEDLFRSTYLRYYYVFLNARDRAFVIGFSKDSLNTEHRLSAFVFFCYNDRFVPINYETDFCGNGTRTAVAGYASERVRQAALFLSVMTNKHVVQEDQNCADLAKTMTRVCKKKSRFKAAKLCWPLLGQQDTLQSLVNHSHVPTVVYRHCAEFVCSRFKNQEACAALRDELEGSPELYKISKKISDKCP